MNRNKRSIVLNLKSDDGVTAIKRLLSDADVFIENYRAGAMDRAGLGYDALSEVNPR